MAQPNTPIILIPAYKPDDRLHALVTELLAHFEVVVVDDGSGSAFTPIFDALPDRVVLLRHPANMGKGAALKTGINAIAHRFPNQAVITADSDGQHTTNDILKLAQAMQAQPEALVLGCRQFTKDIPLRSRFGNLMTKALFRPIVGFRVSDTQTGLRGLPAAHLQALAQLPGNRYEYEFNMLLWTKITHVPIVEIPIQTIYIDNNSSSHFHVIRDSSRIYRCLLRFAFRHRV